MQTAVRWLAEAISKLGYVSTDILEQAEEMQKEQMKNAILHQINSRSMRKIVEENFDDYYNETYGSKGSDKQEQKKLITEIMNEDAKDGLYTTVNWGGVVQHIPNMCNCHQSNCHLINGKYICATCNKTLNIETQPITSSQTEISDEEIEKEANNMFAGDLMWSERIAFKVAIKWYREQLKKKQ